MSWTTFKDIASEQLDKKGMTDQMQESLVLVEANALLVEFFGKEHQDKARALYWKDNILTVAVLIDSLAEKLDNNKQEFIDNLNNKFTSILVSDIRFLV